MRRHQEKRQLRQNDTALTDANGRELSTKQNAELLKDVIREQDRILHQYGLEDTPQLIALYKEVENCWYGGDRSNPNNADKSAALVFDDEITSLLGADTNRIVMFCEDNNGYLRTLGEYGEKDRFNYGLYYHFDFVGSPHTSMWTNTMPLQRSWDNLTTAYEYGVDDAWMINVTSTPTARPPPRTPTRQSPGRNTPWPGSSSSLPAARA